MNKPTTMMCIYRPKPGKEDELLTLVQKHWPVLEKAELVTNDAAVIYRATDKTTRCPKL